MTYYPRFQVGENKLNAELLNRLVGMLQWYEGQARKLEIKKPKDFFPPNRFGFWAVILNQYSDGPNRWRYDWREAKKPEPGYGKWEIDLEGRASEPPVPPDPEDPTDPGDPGTRAYNLIENINDGQMIEGNGVDVENLPGTFALQPVPVLTVVRMWPVRAGGPEPLNPPPDFDAGTINEYWFSYENAVDGLC